MTALHIVERGRGPVLLCLHGIGSSARSFAEQLSGLSDRLRVVAWDAPGYGSSPDVDGPATIDAYAEAAIGVLEEVGHPAHLLGSSWGGVIAATVALRRPEILRSLILVGASRGSGRDSAGAAAMRARADELAALGSEAFARARAPRLLSPQAPPALVEEVARTMAAAVRLPGYRRAISAMAAADLGARLGQITTPTLVMYGADDAVTGRPESEHLTAAIDRAVLVSVRDAGHLVHQEAPRSVNGWVSAFVDIVDGEVRRAPRDELAWT